MAKLSKICTTKKRSFCTLYYQLYLRGQDNNAAENLASIRNNSGNNEPHDVSAMLETLVVIMPSIKITIMWLLGIT
jgi:hypothetical protein